MAIRRTIREPKGDHYDPNCDCVFRFWDQRNITEIDWIQGDNRKVAKIWRDLLTWCCFNNEDMPLYKQVMRERLKAFGARRGVEAADMEIMKFDIHEYLESDRKRGSRSPTAKRAATPKKPLQISLQPVGKDVK